MATIIYIYILYNVSVSNNFAKSVKNANLSGNRGSLYGLPISVKECFRVQGYDATIGNTDVRAFSDKALERYMSIYILCKKLYLGMAQFIDQPAEADGPIIEFIKVSLLISLPDINDSQRVETLFFYLSSTTVPLVFEQKNMQDNLCFPFRSKNIKEQNNFCRNPV
jgi:hypothetical protein